VLTYNEVELHQAEHPNNALAVVKHVVLDRTGPTARGGELHLIMPWKVEQDRLRPIAYRYQFGTEAAVKANSGAGQPHQAAKA